MQFLAMKPLLQQGTKLVIVSGTTYDKIAGGKFHTYFTEEEQKNLFFGLGRGAYNYHITDGRPEIFASMIPDQEGLLKSMISVMQSIRNYCGNTD